MAKTANVGQLVTAFPHDYYPATEWKSDMAWGAAEIALADEATGAPAAQLHANLLTAARWAGAYIAQGHPADGDTFNLYDDGAVAEAELLQAMRQAGIWRWSPVSRGVLLSDLAAQLRTGEDQAKGDPFALGTQLGASDAAPHAFGLFITDALYQKYGGSSQYESFAQQQLNFALGANGWGTSFVVGAGTVFPHCMQSEIANLAGSLTGTGNIQLGATTNGPSAPANFSGWARSPGCGPAPRATSRRSTPRPPATRITWCPGPPSSLPTTTPPTPSWRSPWARTAGPALADNPLLPQPQPRALKPAVLAIDGGNSKTDVALVASDGTLLASARGPGINAHEVGVDQTVLILDAVVKQAAAQLDGSGSGWIALHTVACLANADLPEEEAEHAAAVQAQGWSATATVVNDTFAILRAGLPDRTGPHWGVAVVCGAGINCVGVAPDGRVTRYLALGTISGDWGGGYGLGLEVLWHAVRAEDGRGPDTAADRLRDQPLRRGAGRGGDAAHPPGQDTGRRPDWPGAGPAARGGRRRPGSPDRGEPPRPTRSRSWPSPPCAAWTSPAWPPRSSSAAAS